MKGLESRIVTKIIKYLREQGGWWQKIHGGVYQASGIPDIIGCYKGRFYGIEVKTPKMYAKPDHHLTKLQQLALQRIREAGGVGVVVCSVEQVKEIVE